jgi:nitroreductase
MEAMARVCLDQAWLKNAAVHFVFLSRLDLLGDQWGARGYRYAMLSAGRLGHAVYLGATALGLGACGIGAFYDGEARRLLRLDDHASMLYLVAAGRISGASSP